MFQLCLSCYVLITLCILVLSFEFDFVWSTRYFPGVSSCLVLPWCLIKDYYLSLSPRLRVPVSSLVCAPWQKTRPNRKRRPFTPFCFPFLKVFCFVSVCVCPAARKSPLVIPAIAHCKSAWEFGGIAASAASPLAASPHARRSREISAAGGGSPKPAGGLPSSWVAAPPGAPFAGDHATGPPLTQCPPARLWLNARRPASDSMPADPPLTQCPPDRRWLKPAGSPLTQARRIAADSSPPDWRWLMPAGRRYP